MGFLADRKAGHEKACEDDELVREGIEEFSEVCYHVVFSRYVTVESVGERDENEERRGDNARERVVAPVYRHRDDEVYWNADYSEKSELVR